MPEIAVLAPIPLVESTWMDVMPSIRGGREASGAGAEEARPTVIALVGACPCIPLATGAKAACHA